MLKKFVLAAAMVFASMTMSFAEVGEDGLHKQPWLRLTFKDLREDLAAANEEGKRMVILFEQRGCIYCSRLHENVFSDGEVRKFIEDNYFVVQMNLFGDEEVTDFDGEVQTEKTSPADGALCSPRPSCSCLKRWRMAKQQALHPCRPCRVHLANGPR